MALYDLPREVAVLMNTGRMLDDVLDRLAQLYPDVSVRVKPALEMADIIIVEIEREGFPEMQLITAENSAVSTIILGRYTFDNLKTSEVVDFMDSIYKARYSLRARRFPWKVLSLTVLFGNTSSGVVAPYRAEDLDPWEIEALHV